MILEFYYQNDLTPNYPENRPTFTFCPKRHSLHVDDFILINFLRNEVRLFWLHENSLRLCRRLRLSETIWEIGLMAQMVAGCLWRLTRPETNIMSQRVLFIPSQSPVKVSKQIIKIFYGTYQFTRLIKINFRGILYLLEWSKINFWEILDLLELFLLCFEISRFTRLIRKLGSRELSIYSFY